MSEKDLKVSEMIDLSYKLWEKNKDNWSPMEPIIKKKKEDKIMNDKEIRERHFIFMLNLPIRIL